MALFDPQDPQGVGDLPTHIHNTFIYETLQANVKKKGWGFTYEGAPLRQQSGENVSVPIEGRLPVNTDTLTPDSDPAPLASSDSAALVPCNPYGDYVLITEDAVEQKDMDTINSKTKALAEHALAKSDLIAGTAAVSGTNVAFANGKADEDALLATDIITALTFIQAKTFLENNDCPTYDDGYFRAFLHSACIGDLFADDATAKGFLEQVRYAKPEALINAEIGIWHGFRIYRVSQANLVTNGAATGTADLLYSMFMGKEYMGYTERRASAFSGFKPAGDIMEQQWKMLWKGRWGWGRIKEENGWRFESRSAYSPNP